MERSQRPLDQGRQQPTDKHTVKGTSPKGYDDQVMNQTIDLDGLVPHEFHDIRIKDRYTRFNTKTLIDWRKNERKLHAFHINHWPKHFEFWIQMTSLLKTGKEKGAKKVWVCHPDNNHERIMEFDGSLRFVDPVELINPHIGSPQKSALIIKGVEAKTLYTQYDKSKRIRRRIDVFSQAFYESIKLRLEEHTRQRHTRDGYQLPSTFIVTNDGRSYVFENKNYTLQMVSPFDTFVCK